jgi:hypothetical protein
MNDDNKVVEAVIVPSFQKDGRLTHTTQTANSPNILDRYNIEDLPPEKREALIEKIIEEKINISIEERKMSETHDLSRSQIDDYVATWQVLKNNTEVFQGTRMEQTFKTGTGTLKIESKSGRACFVATATYEDANHPDVVFLRHYRDKILTKSFAGRIFIKIYYVIGPKLANLLKLSSISKKYSKYLISLLVKKLRNRYFE